MEAFGNPEETWASIMNEFQKKCNNVKGWSARGSYERRQLIFKTNDFLMKALKYAEDFPQLSSEIFHSSTINAICKVLPESLFDKIRYTDEYIINLQESDSNETRRKKCIKKMKAIMEVELQMAIKDCEVYEALKENSANFSSVNNIGGKSCQHGCQHEIDKSKTDKKNPSLKPQDDGHDCKKSKSCNEMWGGLGCIDYTNYLR